MSQASLSEFVIILFSADRLIWIGSRPWFHPVWCEVHLRWFYTHRFRPVRYFYFCIRHTDQFDGTSAINFASKLFSLTWLNLNLTTLCHRKKTIKVVFPFKKVSVINLYCVIRKPAEDLFLPITVPRLTMPISLLKIKA